MKFVNHYLLINYQIFTYQHIFIAYYFSGRRATGFADSETGFWSLNATTTNLTDPHQQQQYQGDGGEQENGGVQRSALLSTINESTRIVLTSFIILLTLCLLAVTCWQFRPAAAKADKMADKLDSELPSKQRRLPEVWVI